MTPQAMQEAIDLIKKDLNAEANAEPRYWKVKILTFSSLVICEMLTDC